MKIKNVSRLFFLPIIFLAAFQSIAQTNTENAPTISVAKTEASGIEYWQPAMGDGLAQMFITEFANLPNFKVLESVALDDLRAERALGESGEVSASEAVKKGEWKGADYTFKSTVTRFGGKTTSYGGGGWAPVPFGGGGFGVKKSESDVQIDWRIIDNATREIVPGASGRAVGVESGTSFNMSSWNGSGGFDNSEFRDSALGKATMKAIAQIVDKLKTLNVGPGARTLNAENEASAEAAALKKVKGSVEMVDGKEIWISLGSTNGFAKGDKIKIYKPIEKRNKKNEVVATDYEPVAEITLVKVQKGKSMGEYDGTNSISEDWTALDSSVNIDDLQ